LYCTAILKYREDTNLSNSLGLVIVGSVALDSIRTPFGERERILGGSACFTGVCSSYFTQVGLVGVVGKDFPPEHVALLKSRGINMDGVYTEEGNTFFWRGYYEGNMNSAVTEDTQLGVFEGFNPTIPESFKSTPFVFLGNIHPALQMRVLEQMPETACIGLDSMNLWIDIENEKLKEVISKVQILFINEGEAAQLTGLASLIPAAEKVLEMGPEVLVIKRGEHGATVHTSEGIIAAPALPLSDVVDPTGAGDTFAGGFMGYLAQAGGGFSLDSLRQALWLGTAMASFTVQDFSLDGLCRAKRESILERCGEIERMVSGTIPKVSIKDVE
jgi:sugar/nucleoside kinase (ribokinase family)